MTNYQFPAWRKWLWRRCGRLLLRLTFYNAYGARRKILMFFGADVTPQSKVRRTVDIDCPWNLRVGKSTAIGDGAVLRASAPISIGDRATVSQLAVLLTEVRDASQPDCPLQRGPITIDDDGWVATEALVLPNTSIGRGAIIGARSTATGVYPRWQIAAGDPTRALGFRKLRHEQKSWVDRDEKTG